MLYMTYEAHNNMAEPVRTLAAHGVALLKRLRPADSSKGWMDNLYAALDLLARTRVTHTRPSFNIPHVQVGERTVPVHEEVACTMPFGTLLRFVKADAQPQPRVLVVAPLSGHFATLLRDTVATLLIDHDVYITDWHNARDVDRQHGRFGFDEYVEHVIGFLQAMGPGTHVVAVCQSCVQTLVAAAVLAEQHSDCQPRSMTLMAGPVDTRVNPTKVNELATSKPIKWFERNLIATVPRTYSGKWRRVYPGFLQLTAFMSMNIERHIKAHEDIYVAVANGDKEKAKALQDFYEEYFAVLDLSADFYLETVRYVFQEYRLPLGTLEWRGRRVNLGAIKRTALLTVEGERDDICSLGQTVAAHDLCTGLRPYLRHHHMQPGVGHYGVFAGKRWRSQIYPVVRNLILQND
ncbi:MAG: polyhydroxyalkanoate depolymerase [Rhodocyclaceae bacterium]|nr:polyhydroxyalkanoate depolymerase [Rhodocyclaceae bacterium]